MNKVIKYFSDNPYIIKFGKEEHLKSLLNGSLYMKEVGFYRKLEEQYMKKGMGDKIDGFMVARKMPIYIHQANREIQLPIPDITYQGFVGDEKVPVFCASLLNDKVLISKNDKEATLHFKRDPYGQDMKDVFGEYFIIVPAVDFINRVAEQAKKKGIIIQWATIKYKNFKNHDNNWLSLYKDNQFGGFTVKDAFFEYQNEFRFIVENIRTEDDEDFFVLELGSICDMAVMGKTIDILESPLTIPEM